LKSVPSWNFTPRRRWNIQILLSAGSCSHFSASPGRKVANRSVLVKSHSTSPSKIGYPIKRMPSKPLFGIPVAVGMSDAVIAMRSAVSAIAGWYDSKTAASAKIRESFVSMTVLRPTIGKPAFSR
jgi:hypothetical protein